jgi:hypothetical protein
VPGPGQLIDTDERQHLYVVRFLCFQEGANKSRMDDKTYLVIGNFIFQTVGNSRGRNRLREQPHVKFWQYTDGGEQPLEHSRWRTNLFFAPRQIRVLRSSRSCL